MVKPLSLVSLVCPSREGEITISVKIKISLTTETPLSEEDSDALQRLLLKAKVKLARGRLSFEKVRQQLISKGLNELATNLREELDKGLCF